MSGPVSGCPQTSAGTLRREGNKMMPGIDGFEVCPRLKADPATSPIPVIFLSALDETADKVKGSQLGAVDYVSKPFRGGGKRRRSRSSGQRSMNSRSSRAQRELAGAPLPA